MQSEIVAEITVRYRDGLGPTQRIVHTTTRFTRIFNPSRPLPDQDSGLEWLVIAVSEGVNDGA